MHGSAVVSRCDDTHALLCNLMIHPGLLSPHACSEKGHMHSDPATCPGSAIVILFEAIAVPVINGDTFKPKLTKKQEKKAEMDKKKEAGGKKGRKGSKKE